MLLAVGGLAACGADEQAALAGITPEACQTLSSAAPEVARFAAGEGERTVGDAKARLAWIDALLALAAEESGATARGEIAQVRTSMDVARRVLAAVPDDRPAAAIPEGVRGSRTGLQYRFDGLWVRTGCTGA